MGEEDYVIPHEVFLKIERRPDKFRYYNAIYVVVKRCVEYAEAEQYARGAPRIPVAAFRTQRAVFMAD